MLGKQQAFLATSNPVAHAKYGFSVTCFINDFLLFANHQPNV
jgi:hypothetical protein